VLSIVRGCRSIFIAWYTGLCKSPLCYHWNVKIFISSLIDGMQPLRQAARAAVITLRHEPFMAEEFGAQPHSPEIACLAGVRQSDLVVLLIGESYGVVQSSGLSATHEEYREAKGRKPILAFVQRGIQPDARQKEFMAEVQSWESGLFREGSTRAKWRAPRSARTRTPRKCLTLPTLLERRFCDNQADLGVFGPNVKSIAQQVIQVATRKRAAPLSDSGLRDPGFA
jgi:Domain of unknown function (DUF4062)